MRLSIALLLLAAAPEFAASASTNQAGRSLPLFFIPNAGQFAPEIRYAVQTPELQAGFGNDFAVFQVRASRFEVRFGGARTDAQLGGEQPLAGRATFLTGGQPSGWRTDLATYET